ncbi:salicylate hydroxylase [Halolamina pelagica]|uniref:Salicylate hydroxylase n=1 Tax=Halolamina pelagica TaxID=699431 RepID=A0A0P7GW55_9EURY|nr:NAD(P)/FAD-dependent oxidoreductase [Halolamina pelagica]KPN29775.1 salicylate hydroxylase [Halolamina pelagica]
MGANCDDTMAPTEASDVLIVGGGLAGLTLANYLSRQGREPLIVERAPEWRGGGYGIGLWADGIDVLDEIDRLETVRERAADPSAFEVRSSDRSVLTRTRVPTEETLLLAVHRGDLHAALRESVPDDWVRMGTEPARIEEHADGVDVTFDDGTGGTFDLVVGADGVHSTVREQCFADWTLAERDTYVWSLWAPQDVDLESDMVSVWGRVARGSSPASATAWGSTSPRDWTHVPTTPATNSADRPPRSAGNCPTCSPAPTTSRSSIACAR